MTVDTTKLPKEIVYHVELAQKMQRLGAEDSYQSIKSSEILTIAQQFLGQQEKIERLEELLKTAADKLEVCKAHIQQMDSEYVLSEEMQMKYVNTQACIAIDAVVKAARQGGVR